MSRSFGSGIPFFPMTYGKKLLSYFFPMLLEKARFYELHPEVELHFRRGRLCLSTPKAIYSWDDLYDNFYNTFQLLPLCEKRLKTVLVLGFGMGSVPWMLEKKFRLDLHYTGIESHPDIVRWAEKYALPRLKSNVNLIEADAAVYVKTCAETFDMVIVDIFLDDLIPHVFEQPSFLRSLSGRINPGGWILYNRLALTSTDRAASEHFFHEIFRPVFPEATYLDLKTNFMLMNVPIRNPN